LKSTAIILFHTVALQTKQGTTKEVSQNKTNAEQQYCQYLNITVLSTSPCTKMLYR